jgi:hypothetical protein
LILASQVARITVGATGALLTSFLFNWCMVFYCINWESLIQNTYKWKCFKFRIFPNFAMFAHTHTHTHISWGILYGNETQDWKGNLFIFHIWLIHMAWR